MSEPKVEDLTLETEVFLTIAEVKALRHLLANAHGSLTGGSPYAARPLIEALDQKLKDSIP